ncbi:MAG: cache domain-containing protein [Cytophagaceae bacterium]
MLLLPDNKKLRRGSRIACALSLILLITLIILYIRQKHHSERLIAQYGKEVTEKAAFQIDSIMTEVIHLSQNMAGDITSGKLASEEIPERLKKESLSNENIIGITAAYEPFCYRPEVKLYAPYFDKKQDKILQCEVFYDYSNRKDTLNNWYILPVIQNKARFNEPGFGTVSGTMVTDYGVPFYNKEHKDKPAGTVTATFSLRGLNILLHSLNLGKTGYGMVISQKGSLLAFPSEDYLKARKTIFDLALEQKDAELEQAGKRMVKGESGMIEQVNQVTGHPSLLLYAPIKSTGWSIAVVLVKAELQTDQDELRRGIIHIALASVLFVTCLIIVLTGAYNGEDRNLWIVSMTSAISLVVCIGLIWHEAISIPLKNTTKGITISDKISLNSFLNARFQQSSKLHDERPTYIPTGVFVSNVEFNDANNVSVSGYVWQKYTDGIHDSLSRGFIFPEIQPSAEALFVEQAYKRKEKNTETIGWNFRVTLRENFVYSKYPLDLQNVHLMVRHADFDRNVILIPDLDSYKLINPTALPGLVKDIILPGWKVEGTYFDYKIKEYNTDFGISNFSSRENFPEMYYNITLKRNILTPFISNFIPIIVVAIMLFQVMISATKVETKNTNIGFNAFGVLESAGAFFFVIMLAHIELRGTLNNEEITYMEYFYFIVYLMLLLVSIDSMLFTLARFSFLEHRDNLLPKLMYWPTFIGLCLVITLAIFY